MDLSKLSPGEIGLFAAALSAIMAGIFALVTATVNALAARSQARITAQREYRLKALAPLLQTLDRRIGALEHQEHREFQPHQTDIYVITDEIAIMLKDIFDNKEPLAASLTVSTTFVIKELSLYFSMFDRAVFKTLSFHAANPEPKYRPRDGEIQDELMQLYSVATFLRHELERFIFQQRLTSRRSYRRAMESMHGSAKYPFFPEGLPTSRRLTKFIRLIELP